MDDVIDFQKYSLKKSKKKEELSNSERDFEIKKKATEILKQATQLLMLVADDL